MMVKARGLTLQEPLIPLVLELSGKNYQHINLTHQVPIGGGNTEKRKAEVLSVENGLNVEYLLQAVLEFQDAAIKEQLSLTTEPNLYSYFCQTLTGKIRDEFNIIWLNHPNTVNGF